MMFWFGNSKERKPRKSRRPEPKRTPLLSGRRTFVEHLEQRALLTMLPPVFYPGVVNATAVETADFNGDGRADVLTDYGLSNVSSVRLGNGDGTLQAAVSQSPGNQLVTGDFNHDGKEDIAGRDTYTSSIYVEFGDGDGSFQPPIDYPVGAQPISIDSGDYNGDGYDDIATSSLGYGGTSQVLLGGPTGLMLPFNETIGVYGGEVHHADLDHDGHEDLIYSDGTLSFGVLMGKGDGTFQSMIADNTSIASNDIAFGDFNKDGNVDTVVTDGHSIEILLGTGTGGFKADITVPVNPSTQVRVADLNSDGNLDVLTNSGDVVFGRGDGTFYAPVNYPTLAATGIAIADVNGDGSPDVVTASSKGIGVSLNAHNDQAALAGASGLMVSAPSTVTAGTPFAVTVSAVDANGNVMPGFLGTVGISSMPGQAPVSYTFTSADAGTHTISAGATLFTAGTHTITVTSPFLSDASASVNVIAAAASHFSVLAPPTAAAGQPANITVTALDPYGNVAQGYTGTVHFTSSDVQAGLPADYTFTAADASAHTFAATLKTAGFQTITANDLASPIVGTSALVSVSPAAAISLGLSGGGGFIGSPNVVRIVALDPYGNIDPSYNGVVHLASSDPNSTVSADAPLTRGVGAFTVTPMTIGTQTLAASDVANASIVGSENIQVTAGWAVRFAASPLAATVAGQTQMMTVTAYDAFGDVSDVYTGTIAVTSAGRTVGSYTFTPADHGVHAVPVTLTKAGLESVTVYDVANPAVNYTQTGILVTPAAAASIWASALHAVVAGTAQGVTVTAYDAYGNVATGYLGTVNLSSSDTQAVFPASYTFTAADAGMHTFAVVLESAGDQTFSVVDAANATSPAFASSQANIVVTPAAPAAISISAPSNVTAGVAFNVTVSIVDAYGNVVPNYRGTIHFTGPLGAGNLLPADYTFTAADNGSHTFSVTLASTGTQTVGAQDTVLGSISGQTSVKVTAASTGGGGTTSSGGGTTSSGGGTTSSGGGTTSSGGGTTSSGGGTTSSGGGTTSSGGGGTTSGGGGGGGKLTGA